jgi:hypothetical protein
MPDLWRRSRKTRLALAGTIGLVAALALIVLAGISYGSTGKAGQAQYVQYCQYSAHDVAIKKFTVPQSARSNQTRQITVGISNNACPDTVQVQLFKNNSLLLGTLTQFVPVRGKNRTTDFDFSYTFTSTDATAKKVTFTAVATIIGAPDAFPSDNIATATTKVSK